MIITNEFKIVKTFDGTRSVVAHHRPAIEVESYTEEPIILPPGETRDLIAENGLVLVSPHTIVITGDVNLTVHRHFACFSPLNVTIVNDASNTSDMEVRAYIF